MYAIVKSGGKQYRVERGQTLLVERLAADEGADVALEPILYRSEEAVFDAAGLKDVKVTAKVVAHVRGEKLRVFKFKPKRGYKRRTGHRQELTRIEVLEISAGRAKAANAGVNAAGAGADAGNGAKPDAKAAGKPEPKAAAKPEAKAAAKPEAKAAGKPAAKAAKAAKPAGAKGAAGGKAAAGKAAGGKAAAGKAAAGKERAAKADQASEEKDSDGS
jgi:large subunit ribosomal protein L21